MAREDALKYDFCKIIKVLTVVTLITINGVSSQRVKVDPEVTSYPGQPVNLRCAFAQEGGITRTQVSWIYEPKEGERMNIAVYHPSLGVNYPPSPVKGRVAFLADPPNLDAPSIQIVDAKMSDEGKYICEFATYPTGNEQGVTSLIMLAKPRNSASTVTVVVEGKPVTVARCESVEGLPPAIITWVTTANGNASTTSKAGADNTVTVTSEYKIIPTAADNGRDISCVVSHKTQTKAESFPLKLAVEFPPQLSIVGYDNNWYVGRTNVQLTCQATGNPIPTTVVWKTLTGEMPDTVLIKENKLTVLKVDESVNTTFVCEVKNRLGVGKAQITTLVREPSVNPSSAGVVAGAVIGSLLALLLVGALIAVLVTRNRRQQQGYRGNGKGAYDIKSRIFGGGKKASKNGTGNAGTGVAGGNNNGPIYVYSENSAHQGLSDKPDHHQPLHLVGGGGEGGVATTPTAQDILLSAELDEAERRKFDELDDEEERYDHFGGGAPILQLRPPQSEEGIMGGYLDDDMESQRDGSVISRTAVYV